MLDCEDYLIDLFLPNYTCIISILLDVFFKLWCSSARTRLLFIAVSIIGYEPADLTVHPPPPK